MNKVSARTTSMLQLWFWLFINFIGWLLLGCFGCLTISVVMVAWYGQQTGYFILQNLIHQNFQYLLNTTHPNTSLLVHGWLNNLNSTFTMPNIAMPQQFKYMQEHLHKIENMLSPYLGAILLGLNILFFRLYLLLRWCPLALLLGLAGLVDGLAQRNIRRASAGRESALIYHQAKALILFSLILGVFFDLVLPIQADQSEWILVTAAILFGVAVQTTAKSFKKYL